MKYQVFLDYEHRIKSIKGHDNVRGYVYVDFVLPPNRWNRTGGDSSQIIVAR